MNNIRLERIRFLLGALDAHSKDPALGDRVLSQLKLDRSRLEDAGLDLPEKSEMFFVRFACELLNDNSFGARAGLEYKDGSTLTAYIARYSRNLRDAIEHSAKYYTILDRSFEIGLRVSGNSATFLLHHTDPSAARFVRFIEFVMFSALGRMRGVTGTAFYPMEIRFQHKARDVAPEIARLAGFPVVFGAERAEMILPLSSLELPIPTFDPNLRTHLTEYGNRLRQEQEAASSSSSLRSRVEEILIANLPGRIVPADDVAASLGMSRRSFARHLREQGDSYREIVDELRADLACNYLKDGFQIAEIAFYLDYADQAAFSTAFKRWTGKSPSAYRAGIGAKS